VGIVVTGLVPLAIEPTPVTLFFGGMVAVCAWILPGLSGSFVLLVLGLYTVVIDAIERLDVITLASLGAGCAVGLVSFAQLLSRLLHRFRDETLAVLTGFMVGSLVKLWPWKLTVRYQIRSDGSQLPLVQEPLMPGAYSAMTGNDADMLVAIVAAIGGFALVLLIDFLAKVVPRDA
jgi:putative membrane protein